MPSRTARRSAGRSPFVSTRLTLAVAGAAALGGCCGWGRLSDAPPPAPDRAPAAYAVREAGRAPARPSPTPAGPASRSARDAHWPAPWDVPQTAQPADAHADDVSPPPAEVGFRSTAGAGATSTFAVDVDTASYAAVRRSLRHGSLPPAELVRVEELLNAFELEEPPPPEGGPPLKARVEVTGCPWAPGRRLARVTLRGRAVDPARRPAANLVFLIDVSGSMASPERLPLVKQALALLTEQLGERDRVAIVVYAGAAGLVLPPTCGADRRTILDALDRLEAGGSTHGAAGIELAYRTAAAGFVEHGVNRVVLCTDGDFNVGVRSQPDLERLIAAKARTGVFLSVLGFGVWSGDRRIEALARRGDGHYALIDDLAEARRVLVREVAGTLVTVAQDAKVQVVWDPARVAAWRLVGYENRLLRREQFDDDRVDAGDVGAGHRVTALYEVVPVPGALDAVDPSADELCPGDRTLGLVRLRWKEPGDAESALVEVPLHDRGGAFEGASADQRFLAAVAASGMLLRGSAHAGTATYGRALAWAERALGRDASGQRREWITLLRAAARLSDSPLSAAEPWSPRRGG